MDLPGYEGKVTSDKKMIFASHQRYKIKNRDFCRYFSVIIERTNRFLIDFLRFILAKVRVHGATKPRREIDIQYKFDLKII